MSSEAILLALECIVPERQVAMVDEQAERRREADRVRKAAKRGCPQTSADIPQNSADQKERVSQTLPKEKINNTTRARAKTDLPDDWQPDAKTWALADELGFAAQEAWDQLERMRDWAKNADGSKGRKSDWDAAFRNWLKRTADDRRNKPQAHTPRNSLASGFAILDAVTDEAIRRSDGFWPESGEEDSFGLSGLRQSAA